MSEAEHNLTGRWTGIFNYPRELPPNSFEAELRDVGGLLSGLTTEEDDDPWRMAGTLHAVIEGKRDGSIVCFTKRYDDFEEMPDTVIYTGSVHPSGDEIDGRWDIPGVWSGTFLMVRSGKAEAEEEREVSEEIGLR